MLSKFLIYVDYLSGSLISSEYVEISANKLEDAILAADCIYDSGKHYLVSVMEKTSPVTSHDGISSVEYTAVMTLRQHGGWCLCNGDNEHKHKTRKCWFRNKNRSPEPWYNEL